MPLALLDMLALLLTKVEELGCWPTCLARGLITLVPKGEGAHPLKLRPLSVLSLMLDHMDEASGRNGKWI